MARNVPGIMQWVPLLGGLFGLGASLLALFNGSDPVVYGVLGIGVGLWLLFSAITIHIREQSNIREQFNR